MIVSKRDIQTTPEGRFVNVGGKLLRLGRHEDIPNEEYHSLPGISSSGCKMLAGKKPPLLYWHKYLNPEAKKEPEEDKEYLATGSALHCLVGEPHKFNDIFVVAPDLDKRTKKYREWLSSVEGKTILSRAQFLTAKGLADSLLKKQTFLKVLNGSYFEESFIHVDEETGAIVRIRPDLWRPGSKIVITDLKTAAAADGDSFSTAVWKFGYDIQAAMYSDVMKACIGEIDPDLKDSETFFFFPALEKTPPYPVGFYKLDPAAMQRGHKDYRRALHIYAEQWAKHGPENPWDGYPDRVVTISLPSWSRNKERE